ncbi:unnamed protein product, partial [Pylaiella littoralis]
MTITLVGSSRELKNRRVLPPIDLLNLLDNDRPAGGVITDDAALPPKPKRGLAIIQSPRSLGTVDGFADDMDPFMSLLRSRQQPTLKGQNTVRGLAVDRGRLMAAAASAAAASVLEDATTTVPNTTSRETPEQEVARPGTKNHAGAVENTTSTVAAISNQLLDANICTKSPRTLDERRGASGPKTYRGDSGGVVGDAPYTARAPAQRRPGPTPCYARGTSSAGGGGAHKRRKSRGKDGGVPKSSGHVSDSMLRLCPALEARILDLRRDNTAAARFLSEAQAVAWHKARRPVGVLVSRNRAVCASEGAELSLLRREELAVRAQRRREANRERKILLERRRQKEAEAVRIKHEGPSLAELKALEQAILLERRQRFFLAAVVAINAAVRWRNDWKERKWKLAKIAEAFASHSEQKASEDAFEASVERIQRFIRRRQGNVSRGAGRGGAGVTRNRSPNVVRCLKVWIPTAHARWKRRRREGGVVIHHFLKDSKLSLYNKAIYRFRRKVVRCQVYVKGVSLITRDRMVLLGLFFSRCEVRLRARLAGRVRQQVHDEAAADLEVHRQLMRPSAAAAAAAGAGAAAAAAAVATAAGGRRGGQRGGNSGASGGGGGGVDDDVSALMETVAALRLKSALERLEARSAHPDVKERLLKNLLVEARAAHQANIQLSSGGEGAADRRGGASKSGKGGSSRSRRGVPLPEVRFTVDDARELMTCSPPPPPVPGAAGIGGDPTGGEHNKRHQPSPRRGGSVTPEPLTGSASSPPAVGGERGGSNSGSHSGRRAKTRTRVSPMLLLRGVSEAVMCQLVLAGWERSSSVG